MEAVSHVPELPRLVAHPSEDSKGLRCPLPPGCFAPAARKRRDLASHHSCAVVFVLRWSLVVTGIRWY